jgi:hypothetical protein
LPVARSWTTPPTAKASVRYCSVRLTSLRDLRHPLSQRGRQQSPATEGMWPMGTQVEVTITTLVIGLPRQVVVQRCDRADVDLVLRDDGAVWPGTGCQSSVRS